MSGGSSPQVQTSSTAPWAVQQPYLRDVFSNAQSNFRDKTPTYFPGQTVANQGADTVSGQNVLRNFATGAGQSAANQALNTQQFVTNPNLLDPASNPYLASSVAASNQPVIDSFLQQVLPNLRGGAVQAGQFGGTRQGIAEGIATNKLTQTLANNSSRIFSGAYQNGLSTLLQGLSLAPSTLQAGQIPAQALDSIGRQLQAQDQAVINSNVDRHNFQQNLPAQQLAQYKNLIDGSYGGQSVQTSPGAKSNPLGAALGGAAAGASVGGPYGAAAGGALGLLSSFI